MYEKAQQIRYDALAKGLNFLVQYGDDRFEIAKNFDPVKHFYKLRVDLNADSGWSVYAMYQALLQGAELGGDAL